MEERIYPIEVKEGDSLRPLVQAPEVVLQEAQKAASALQRVVAGKKRPVIFRGEQYLEFEDWQTVAKFYGFCARTLEAEPVEIFGVKGAKARAEVVDLRTGLVVGGAEAYCMRDEENWQGKPWFQLASMAQTRAGAKALRNVLAWVVVLAGYRPTPAEEIQEAVEYRKGKEELSGKGPGGSSQKGGSGQANGASQDGAPSGGVLSISPQGGARYTPSENAPSEETGESASGDLSNREKPSPLNIPHGDLPTKEEVQNLLRLALRNGFSTVNAEGKKCVDYPRLGEFLRSNGFSGMIKGMSRKELQEAALLLESRARSLFS
ncbi:MAG: hypothetical protein QMD88_03110 [Coprothermobacterota bacterium]|nr:hypothetical protein [Coprothermobacterota bacterium]